MEFIRYYKHHYNYVKQRNVFDNGRIRLIKNFYNLGLWLVKDSQGRHTLNLFYYRIQF